MAVEFTRFCENTRITVTFPKAPPGRMDDWQAFLFDVAKSINNLAPHEGVTGPSLSNLEPCATRHEGDPAKEIKVQIISPCAPMLPLEAGGELLELLIQGIGYVYDQERDTAWHLGVLISYIKDFTDFLAQKVVPSHEKMEELRVRYGYPPLDTISRN